MLFRRKCSKTGNKNRGGAVCLAVEITSQQHGRLMSTISETLELWGGPECTIVRIGDQFRNELEETGHLGRLEDLDAIAEVGIRTVRYPVLWETTSPHDPDQCDWRWSDERLARLKRIGHAARRRSCASRQRAAKEKGTYGVPSVGGLVLPAINASSGAAAVELE